MAGAAPPGAPNEQEPAVTRGRWPYRVERRHPRSEVKRRVHLLRARRTAGRWHQRAFAAGAPLSSRWRTVMAYGTQCSNANIHCRELLRFSNPRQRREGDPLGVPYVAGASGVAGPSDAAAVLDVMAPAAALWRDRVARSNRPPTAVGALPDVFLAPGGARIVDASEVFSDLDGDPLTWAVSSSMPEVATVTAAGPRVTVTAVGAGAATVTVTATDPGGLSAVQSFTAMVSDRPPVTFTDHPIQPGVTPVRAVHYTELRTRIDALRQASGSGAVPVDGSGADGGGDAGPARPSPGSAGGPRRRVRGGGSDAAGLDRRGAGGAVDADPGGAPDGAARGGDGAGVSRRALSGAARPCWARRRCRWRCFGVAGVGR